MDQMSGQSVEFEREFHSSIPLVWEAITEPTRMRRWFFEEMETFKAEVGFCTEFDVAFDGKHFIHQWEIMEVLPQKRITYSWRYAGYPGDGKVIWELASEADRTRLTLTVEGIDTFPQDVPEFTRESCIQGWTYFLDERLRGFLEEAES